MDRRDALLEQLASSCDLSDDAKIERFQDAVSGLREWPSEVVLRRMLRCFRDVDAGEVQYELVEACESYPLDQYVAAFTAEFATLAGQSRQWFRLLFQSILNTPEAADLFVWACRAAPSETRRAVGRELSALCGEAQQYRPILDRIQRPNSGDGPASEL